MLAFVALAVGAAPARAMEITSVSPDSFWSIGSTRIVTIEGSGFTFDTGYEVRLSQGGKADAVAVSVESVGTTTQLYAVIPDLGPPSAGRWDLSVTHPILDAAVLPGAVFIRETPVLERIGSWGGPVQSIEIIGNIAYVARGSGLLILDITDPTNMVRLSAVDVDAVVFDVTIRGSYAYVATRYRGIKVIDVSDVRNPQLIVTLNGPDAIRNKSQPFTDVAFAGTTLLALRRERKSISTPGPLWTLDIRNPASLDPVEDELDSHTQSPTGDQELWAIAVADGHLYTVRSAPELALDVYALPLDPNAPLANLAGSAPFFLSGHNVNLVTDIAFDGGFAYVTICSGIEDSGGALATVDVTDPAAPFLTDVDLDLRCPTNLTVAGGVVYVADYEPGRRAWGLRSQDLFMFDVATDPSHPTPLANAGALHGTVHNVTVSGSTAFVGNHAEGIVAWDVSTPTSAARIGTYYSPADMGSLDKEGDLLYVCDHWTGVTALDVSDPLMPVVAGHYQTTEPNGGNGEMKVRNGIAYLAAGFSGLEVIDFTNPAAPVLIGGYDSADMINHGLALRGDALVVANLGIFNVADPANPAYVSSTGGSGERWAITEDFMAVGFRPSTPGGTVHDLLDLANPLLNITEGGGGGDTRLKAALSIDMEGNRIYTSSYSPGYGEVHGYEVGVSLDDHRAFTVTEFVNEPARGSPSQRVHALTVQDGIVSAIIGGFGIGVYDGLAQTGLIDNAPLAERNQAAGGPAMHGSILADGPYVYVGGDSRFHMHMAGYGPSLIIYRLAVPGSATVDGDTDLRDEAHFQRCFSGPGGAPRDAACAVHDLDGDGDVDLVDASARNARRTGPLE